ncbi:LysM domain [Geosmithia morbida]|uniref:LysM domain n=1 Tax=Geosmithia morbida TaxID=1094350 RepID=A0A9P4YUS0_9HYPO|nr:LysM domain [Geosmithia morbida]KAF4122068.1 LysM domain [Geosmithia morbida]
MSRFSRYDTDEERLPEGMTRVGYDADTQVYTFQDSDGSLWEGAPGAEYGQLYRAGQAPDPDEVDADTEPFLMSEHTQSQTSWRAEMMPLLNFFVLVGVSLMALFWYLNTASRPSDGREDTAPGLSCAKGSTPYILQGGDSCWDLAQEHGITMDDIMSLNPGLKCESLLADTQICLPKSPIVG